MHGLTSFAPFARSTIPARFIDGLADGPEIVALARKVAASTNYQGNP